MDWLRKEEVEIADGGSRQLGRVVSFGFMLALCCHQVESPPTAEFLKANFDDGTLNEKIKATEGNLSDATYQSGVRRASTFLYTTRTQ